MRSEKSLASASKSLKSSDITSCSVRLTLILVLFTVEQKKMSQFEMGTDVLERLLGGSGTPYGIGNRVWDLLNGSDDTSVSQAREIPRQISIEDSYIKLDTIEQVTKQLRILAISLLRRMRTDLTGTDQEPAEEPPADGVADGIANAVESQRRYNAGLLIQRLFAFPHARAHHRIQMEVVIVHLHASQSQHQCQILSLASKERSKYWLRRWSERL